MSEQSEIQTTGEQITIIGPKNSGKTTYLAGLAHWPVQRSKLGKKIPFHVEATSQDARDLEQEAQDKILSGVYLPPTEIKPNSTVNELPVYKFNITVKQLLRNDIIELVVRDYPGEIYERMAEKYMPPLEQNYIKECLKPDIIGCLTLLDKWERENDLTYMNAMKRFFQEMDKQNRIKGKIEKEIKPLRIAVAISKCERGEIWPGRLDPETDIFQTHLPGMTNLLREKLKNNVKFFAISTFGVLAPTDPKPNRKSEKITYQGKEIDLSILRNTQDWQPYRMIDPLYWLSKGKAIQYGF